MLTRKQHELLQFIDTRLRDTGVSPSFDEMKDALQLKSKSGVHRLIKGLEERGFLRRLPHRARALEVVRRPEDAASTPRIGLVSERDAADPTRGTEDTDRQDKTGGFSPKVIRGGFDQDSSPSLLSEPPGGTVPEDPGSVSIPLLGKIAAGIPIDALTDPSETIAVPLAMLNGGDHFALTVEGDSMIDAGILDGDTAVLKRCDNAENGAIVCALVKGEEATLKRLRRRAAAIALEPANKAHRTQIYQPTQVAIQGRLVGLLRLY